MSLTSFRKFCCFDFETTGKNPHGCQLTQISAIMIDSKTLRFIPGAVFDIEVKPEFDDTKAIADGYDPVESEALKVTGKTREQLELATDPKVAWNLFTQFVNRYNSKGTSYFAPIPVGFNINGYDMHVLNRYTKKYGPTEENGKQKLLHQIFKVDMMDLLYSWFEDDDEVKKINLPYLREYFEFPETSKDNAHNALFDVIDTANIFIQMMKFQREQAAKTKFAGAFKARGLELDYGTVLQHTGVMV